MALLIHNAENNFVYEHFQITLSPKELEQLMTIFEYHQTKVIPPTDDFQDEEKLIEELGQQYDMIRKILKPKNHG